GRRSVFELLPRARTGRGTLAVRAASADTRPRRLVFGMATTVVYSTRSARRRALVVLRRGATDGRRGSCLGRRRYVRWHDQAADEPMGAASPRAQQAGSKPSQAGGLRAGSGSNALLRTAVSAAR